MRLLRWLAALGLALTSLVIGPLPARACACGAVITHEQAAVSGETSLIWWDGRTESIDMVMRLSGQAADAAWVMPVPTGAEVELGDEQVFTNLARASAPTVKTRYDFVPRLRILDAGVSGAAPGSGPTMSIDSVATVGPFRVTTLSGTDAGAVDTWLTEQGYPTRPDLVPSLQSYLDDGWSILAVRLTPEAQGDSLRGDLSPLRMTFPASEPVYPIRLSAHARTAQQLVIYVAAPHRMQVTADAAPGIVTEQFFAGEIASSDTGRATDLRPGTEGSGVYLTGLRAYLPVGSISADYKFGQAPDDTPFREVVYVEEYRGTATLYALGLVATLAITALLTRRFRGQLNLR